MQQTLRAPRQFVTAPVQRTFAASTPKVVASNWVKPVLVGVALTFLGMKPSFAAERAAGPTGPEKPSPSAPSTSSAVAGMKLHVAGYNPTHQAAERIKRSRPDEAKVLTWLAEQPTAVWFGEWSGDVRSSVDQVVSAAAKNNTLATLVAYNITSRDCGMYSAGGASNAKKYRAWIAEFARGLNGRKAIVVLEPDALASMTCMPADAQNERMALLKESVGVLKQGGALVYIDAGNAKWHHADTIASRLKKVGIEQADGFALNVSNFYTTSQNIAFGEKLSKLVGGKHFIIDTSRNGLGSKNDEWCNSRGRAIGEAPTTRTNHPLVDALLWIKRPGESDGTCEGGPRAGEFWTDYAMELVRNAGGAKVASR